MGVLLTKADIMAPATMTIDSSTADTRPDILAAAAIKLCDEPGCGERATHSFITPWSNGDVCAKHQRLKAQRMQNLKRQVTFGVIVDTAPKPLRREERVQFRASIMTLEEEIKEVRIRAEEMYRNNQKLVAQVQRLSMVENELKAQVSDAKVDVESAQLMVLEREEQLAEASEELNRLRVLFNAKDIDKQLSDGEASITD